MEDKFVKLNTNANWSEYTFIFASVSVGNIGQLATDLLISTFPNTNKAGYLISSLIQPIMGYDAYVQKSQELSLSCELYENQALKIVLCQQRAPLFKGKRNEFVNLLTDFIKTEKFKEAICLASSHAYERLDSQLSGSQCRYLAALNDPTSTKKLNWTKLEKRHDHDFNHNIADPNSLNYFIPGGGIAQKFFKMSQEKNLNSYVLLVFAHEGNNIPEAFQLANYLNEWKDYLSKFSLKTTTTPNTQWRVPISWKYLFGQAIDPNIESQIF